VDSGVNLSGKSAEICWPEWYERWDLLPLQWITYHSEYFLKSEYVVTLFRFNRCASFPTSSLINARALHTAYFFIRSIARDIFYNHRLFTPIPVTSQYPTAQLVHAFVLSRLDDWYTCLTRVWHASSNRRFTVASGRLVMNRGPRYRMTFVLRHMHWLPVQWRGQFTLCYFHVFIYFISQFQLHAKDNEK